MSTFTDFGDELLVPLSNDGTLSPLPSSTSQSQTQQRPSCYYCLLLKEYTTDQQDDQSTTTTTTNTNTSTPQSSFTLKIIQTNANDMQSINIKSFILSKSLKNMIYKTGSIGTIEEPEATNLMDSRVSLTAGGGKSITSCYYTLIEIQQPIKDTDIDTDVDTDNTKFDDSKKSSGSIDITNSNNNSPIVNFEDLDFSININDNQSLIADMESCGNIIQEYCLCLCYEYPDTEPNRLEAFHLELRYFCHDIGFMLKGANQEELDTVLTSWYSICINYMPRAIDLFNDQFMYILHASLKGSRFEITANKSVGKDIINFLKTISILNPSVTMVSNNGTSDDTTINTYLLEPEIGGELGNKLLVKIVVGGSGEINVNYTMSNGFCKRWCKKFLDNRTDSLSMRNLSEEIKLKVIQELNLFRRMVDSSKNNNYLLYKCYLFLLANDNCDILLDLLKKDNDDPATDDILNVLSNSLA
ncbi:hypothetical protein SAMD00019534_071740 [Acytostelium subglobosum LB1]|uniref:hypothetical protein n=1 Tax=Acytostelium subglobosum LB1 TaxID=1410327 RepID=UPI0006449912|nr:hypothetical protein SAMD00019534_071740 [Acytostelium subglobosum LB1]GAM23999.1 hypothetical protein SAMD00019534_071740 [Acytostelium subglobosum LB1]|eukprot:XP_012753035.1 hypothetical protein SAMD00019534_071740 [Acytostelium subglobosum LB1]